MIKNKIMIKELKIIQDAIKQDRDMFYSYQKAISMCFIDTCANYKKKRSKKYLSSSDIYKVANDAAIAFLNNWIKE